MKVLLIEDGYYLYPENIETFAELVETVNRNPDVFIHFCGFSKTSYFPYLIKEDRTECALKFRNIRTIREVDAVLMEKAEYERDYIAYCRSYCKNCVHFTDQEDEDFDTESHEEYLALHGRCWRREIREPEQE